MSRMSIETPADLIYFAMSFIEPRAVQVACQLKLFTYIARDIHTVEQLAHQTNCNVSAITRVLLVCASLGLVYINGEEWHLHPLARLHLVEDEPAYLGSVFIMSSHSFHSFDQLPSYVTTGTPIAAPPHRQELAVVQDFIHNSWSMGRVQAEYMVETIMQQNFIAKKAVLDIGAGSGVYAISFLKYFPSLHYWAVDLPHMVQVAELPYEEENIKWLGCDVFAEGLPNVAFDVAVLASFIHGFSQHQIQQLLLQIYQALPEGGVLLIQDHFLRSDPRNPGMAALFNLNIALHNANGGVQTLHAMEIQLRAIGFKTVDVFDPAKRPGLMPVILSRK